jgi:hypothetical protein
MSVQASCPACGGLIQFKVGSAIVTVCPYCRSVVARGDRTFEDLGKVAALTDTDSPLQLGLKGRYHNFPFELVGRAQLRHPAGGVWDEWYAAFANGRWGWLAEAQGHFYLTFQQQPLPAGAVPLFAQLPLGGTIVLPTVKSKLVVAEKGEARAVAAEGEMPYRLRPGETYDYADLSGEDGLFATLDYSGDVPLLYLGKEVPLDALGFPATARHDQRHVRQIAGVQLSCPQCGGPLELRAPDRTERVTCPNCGSLLDVTQGQLRFFQAIEPRDVNPVIPLGTVGKLPEGELTAIGYLLRSVTVEQVKYFWEEYLLYNPRVGFRWLTCSDHHWNYVQPVPPGQVQERGRKVGYANETYKRFQRDTGTVEHVLGEFYWKVSAGEHVEMVDYIHPPRMLSQEVTVSDAASEINWSLGTYVPRKDIQRAFNVRSLAAPVGIAPNQPFPYKPIYRAWLVFLLIALLMGVVFLSTGTNQKVFERTFILPPPAAGEKSQVFFTPPFELKSGRNIQVEASAPVENSWIEVGGDLIDEATGLIQPFDILLEYYHGSDGGESWSEGSQIDHVYLSAVPSGTYIIRLEFEREAPAGMAPADPQTQAWMQEHREELLRHNPAALGTPVVVRVTQGVRRPLHWFLTLLALSVLPIGVLCYHWSFTVRRWKDSPYKSFMVSSE